MFLNRLSVRILRSPKDLMLSVCMQFNILKRLKMVIDIKNWLIVLNFHPVTSVNFSADF